MDPNSPLGYQWQEGVENLEGYRSGGYHPTHIGDQYCDSRYEVVHKLGYGSYSTVWLAKDHLEARHVSLENLDCCYLWKKLRVQNSSSISFGEARPSRTRLCAIAFE